MAVLPTLATRALVAIASILPAWANLAYQKSGKSPYGGGGLSQALITITAPIDWSNFGRIRKGHFTVRPLKGQIRFYQSTRPARQILVGGPAHA